MSRPWMPLYCADFLGDTGDLTAAETGAYLCLIMHYWLKGELPTDAKKLARIARMSDAEWLEHCESIASFFDEHWKHARIDKELAEAEAAYERRANAGKKGGKASKQKQSESNASALLKQSPSQPQSSNEDTSLRSGAAPGAQSPDVRAEAKSKSISPKGQRIPEGWEPSEADFEYAVGKLGHDGARQAVTEFVRYWMAESGRYACKLRWDLTFKNRVDELAKRIARAPPGRPPPQSRPPPRKSAMQLVAEMEAEEASRGFRSSSDSKDFTTDRDRAQAFDQPREAQQFTRSDGSDLFDPGDSGAHSGRARSFGR